MISKKLNLIHQFYKYLDIHKLNLYMNDIVSPTKI